ncbi:hypothetical protein PHYPO_G00224570 [Pangasianodon hypophthalmus]|uniref:RRM domain-containing protein n=1 Tax=Pangasianodon hypophthalmus TaxID=310915 RepID=A0A5N5NV70_PANHP|nr:hypothetical protein PHYPO_G00224570 [Pangasianodon hypophthalmus]
MTHPASGSEHAKSQLELVKKYPKWDQTVESARRNESSEVYKVPTRKEASDFNGTVPPVFPYLCVLCNITVFSEKEWSIHVTSGQHAKSQLDLMEKYPEWDGTVQSSRRNDGHTSTDIRDGTSKENTSDMKMSQAKDEQSSRVVSFTPLPAGDGISAELTAIAKCFGSVRKSLFLPNQGFVEMTCLAEAKKLVEHYSANQLKLKGKLIQVTFSCEYNSLREAEVNDKTQSRSSHTHRRSSPGRDSIQRDSPSPRRRHTEERRSVSNSYVESVDSDSDLEGLEVIADDGEELVNDIDDYEPTTSDQENGEDSPNADTAEASNSLKEGQKFEEHEDQEIKKEDHDFPKILENCVTLDEFTEENSSDCQESFEAKASIPKTEESSNEVTTSTNPVSYMKQSDKESDLPKEESTSKTTAEPNTSENLEDAVDQSKEEQDTERVTDDLKEPFGKVLEVKNLPRAENYTDSDFMNIIKRYGDVTHHVLFRSCKKGFVKMVFASDAERIAADSKNQDIVLRGNILKIKVCEKYCHLPKEGVDSDDEEIRRGEISKESNNKQQSGALNGIAESSNESLKTDEPVGTEFVRPVVGYFCSLCNVIYASEEEAKDEHCRSPSHYEKVKEHKERSGSVENKK